jgi:hypothetical protein
MSDPPDSHVVAEWPINSRERARLVISQYKGNRLINLRKWFEGEDGELRPSKQGIAFGVKHLPRLVEAINAAHRFAIEQGLIDDPSGSQP